MEIYMNDPRAPKPNRPLQPGMCGVIVNAKNEIFFIAELITLDGRFQAG